MEINLTLPIDQVNLALLGLNQLQASAQNTIASIQQQAQAQLQPPAEPQPEKAGGTD